VESRPPAAKLLLPLVAVSLAARLFLCLRRPLWFDEIFTAWAARLSPRALLDALRLDSGPPGFYLLEKPFAALAERGSDADVWLRAPSFAAALLLFAGAATLPGGRSRGAFLGLTATSVLVTLYAAEARPYALLALLCFAAFRLALSREETPPRLLALAIVSAAALYTHYLAILAVGILLAMTLSARRFRSSAALGAGAVAFLPWVAVLRAQPAAATAWMLESTPASVLGFLSALGGVGRIPAPFGGPAPPPLFVAGAGTGVFLLVVVATRARADRELRSALVFVAAVLLAALLAARWRPIAFAGRTEMAVLPVWFWALARTASGRGMARGGTLAAALLGLGATAAVVTTDRPRTETGDVAAALENVSRPGDRIVAAAGLYLPLRREADRGRLAGTLSALPEELAAHPGWFVPALPGPEESRAVARAVDELPAGQRLYLVIPPAYATPELAAALAAPGGRSRELARGPDALVILRTRDPAPPPRSAP